MLIKIRNKKDGKKGFTLVELIVVLLILAILAAMLIPTLVGYIDKAKDKKVITETRQVVIALQTLVDEEYAEKGWCFTLEGQDGMVPKNGKWDITKDEVKKLAEVDGEINYIEAIPGEAKVTHVVYTSAGDTRSCAYCVFCAEGKEECRNPDPGHHTETYTVYR